MEEFRSLPKLLGIGLLSLTCSGNAQEFIGADGTPIQTPLKPRVESPYDKCGEYYQGQFSTYRAMHTAITDKEFKKKIYPYAIQSTITLDTLDLDNDKKQDVLSLRSDSRCTPCQANLSSK
jgi:hypothetical protein